LVGRRGNLKRHEILWATKLREKLSGKKLGMEKGGEGSVGNHHWVAENGNL